MRRATHLDRVKDLVWDAYDGLSDTQVLQRVAERVERQLARGGTDAADRTD